MIKRVALLFFMTGHFTLAAWAQKERFAISIIQDSMTVIPNGDNIVWFQKKPFKIQVELQHLDGVHVYAAFKDSIYKTMEGETIPDFRYLSGMSMAEDSFNINQELLISDDGWSYWFYDPGMDWHRMDRKVVIKGETVKISKTIKQFYLVQSEKTLAVRDVNAPLYLFFFSAKGNDNMELVEEFQRYKVKIQWL
jgi:hypothetical protein